MRALRSGLATLAILLTLGLAAAQQGEDLASPQQKAEQEKAQNTKAVRPVPPSQAPIRRALHPTSPGSSRMAGS